MATPSLMVPKSAKSKAMLKLADLPESGQITLFDGRTGMPFERRSPWVT